MKSLSILCVALLYLAQSGQVESFSFSVASSGRAPSAVFSTSKDSSASETSRREVLRVAIAGSIASTALVNADFASAADDLGYKPAKRPYAYRLDSTQPPTLLPVSNAQQEIGVLTKIGKGLGTPKSVIIDDSVNLNNMLNKAVFGTIDKVAALTGEKQDTTVSGPGFASFVCLGVPAKFTSADVGLANSLITSIVQPRSKLDTALGLAFCPISTQAALDAYTSTGNFQALSSSLLEVGIPETTINVYQSTFELARVKNLKLLALSPENEDIKTARSKGLQYVDGERRTAYVADPDGFIKVSQDPKFRVYADRSLLKDFEPIDDKDSPGLFFSERILVHETAAGVAAKYACERPDSMVIVVAPTPDVRFLQGINGRLSRLCAFLNPDNNLVTDDAVTTILLNPTAKETLSKTNYLRLEVGTGPETLDYQSKLSDYLWFSSMPKVNMIPRLMNEKKLD